MHQPTIKVKVKWSNGKQTFDDVELDPTEPPILFKAQLFTLTGVPTDRQKCMFKGAVIKDDAWPENFIVTNGSVLMLMGSSEKLPEAPVEKPKFVEDMNDNELAAALELPAGLTNLGNTCYMSATVQCLRTVPELREALKRYDGKLSILATLSNEASNQSITAAIRDLYDAMDAASTIDPIILLKVLHTSLPRFAQRGEGGGFQQQDANECWTELTRMLQQNLKPLQENSNYTNFIDQYFGGTFEAEMKCDEDESEPVTKTKENFLQLSCFISQDIKYMQSGLISRMKETITKQSPVLNRDASYTKTSRISRLPAYLTVQFVRFYYKGNVQTNAKLLRDVKFSMILDVYDLCTKELQEKLAPMRAKYKQADDEMAIAKTTQKDAQNKVETDDSQVNEGAGSSSSGESIDNSPKPGTSSGFKGKKHKPSSDDINQLAQYSFEDDPGSNNSGFYELRAVLTHKGRSSSSGHYVAWIKRDSQWFQCDDDRVEAVDSDEILKLSGGGDWHCAYVLLYGPRTLDLSKTKPPATGSVDVSNDVNVKI